MPESCTSDTNSLYERLHEPREQLGGGDPPNGGLNGWTAANGPSHVTRLQTRYSEEATKVKAKLGEKCDRERWSRVVLSGLATLTTWQAGRMVLWIHHSKLERACGRCFPGDSRHGVWQKSPLGHTTSWSSISRVRRSIGLFSPWRRTHFCRASCSTFCVYNKAVFSKTDSKWSESVLSSIAHVL